MVWGLVEPPRVLEHVSSGEWVKLEYWHSVWLIMFWTHKWSSGVCKCSKYINYCMDFIEVDLGGKKINDCATCSSILHAQTKNGNFSKCTFLKVSICLYASRFCPYCFSNGS